MTAIEHTVDIAAPIERVWELTLDVERWPEFSPTMTGISRNDNAPIAVGSTAQVKQPGQRERTWTVTELRAPTTFVWQARALGVTMAGGHHLEPVSDGCRQRLTVELSGPAAPVMRLLAERAIRRALAQENEGFKTRAESP